MSDLIVIQPQVTELTVTEDVNQVVVSSVGVQGPAGATGATGATGAQGPSGVIAVTAPITNSGTSTSANIGIDLSDIAPKYPAPYDFIYRSGFYYESRIGAPLGGSSYTKNELITYPLFINKSVTIDQISANVSVAGDASSVIRLGIYNSDANGLPSTVKVDAGTISTSTTGTKTITISSTTLAAGLYFFAHCFQVGTSSPTLRSYPNTQGNWAPVGDSIAPASAYKTGYLLAGVTGAFPTFSGTSLSGATPARMSFRVA